MTNNLPIAYTGESRSAVLGTANWHRFAEDEKPSFAFGDLWLSRMPSGEPVGYRDDRHVLLVSGTRSGKGASVIIPNLCLWMGSAVVIDPKGENAMVTARRRGHGSAWSHGLGQAVHILDPFGEVRTDYDDFADLKASFNPLDIILENEADAVDEAARMAEAMVVSSGSQDNFFDDYARAILKALILHVASSNHVPDDQRNLATLRHILLAGDEEMRWLIEMSSQAEPPTGIAALFHTMACSRAYGGVVARAGRSFAEALEESPRTLMSAMQVARTNTEFLDSPALRGCLKQSSFRLSDLKTRKATLYLCLPQRYMDSHFRWLRMITTLILGEMERTRTDVPMEHPVLMVLDEFPALGRMKVIENAAAQIAGFGVKLMFVAQTLAQLKDVYKDNWETLVANAGVKLFFGNDDHFTREYVSKLIGEYELRSWGKSSSKTSGSSRNTSLSTSEGRSGSSTYGESTSFGFSGNSSNFSLGKSWSDTSGWSQSTSMSAALGSSLSATSGGSETVHKRALLNPDEVGRFFGDRENPAMLALVSGMQPLALRRTMYFADPVFQERLDPHRDHPAPMSIFLVLAQQRAQVRTRQIALQASVAAENHSRWKAAMQAKMDALFDEMVADYEVEKAAKAKETWRQRMKAMFRGLIQFGFAASLVAGVFTYPPLGDTLRQTGLMVIAGLN